MKIWEINLLLGAPRGVLTCLLILSLRKAHLYIFPDYFSFSHFRDLIPVTFRLRALNSAPNIRLKNPMFRHLYVMVCCCAANQYSEIAFIF